VIASKVAYALCAAYVVIGVFYLIEADWVHFNLHDTRTWPWKPVYWFSAAMINLSVTNMGMR